jgi:hypothetical protein
VVNFPEQAPEYGPGLPIKACWQPAALANFALSYLLPLTFSFKVRVNLGGLKTGVVMAIVIPPG